MEVVERIPFTAQKKIFETLAQIADCRNLNSTEKAKYNASRDAIDDYYSSLVGAWIEGKSNGMAAGRAEGRAAGRAEGRAVGRAEGELNKSLTIAKKMLASGMSETQITELTGLSQEQLEHIKE